MMEDITQYLPMMGGPTATYADNNYPSFPTPSPDSIASKSPEYAMSTGNGNRIFNDSLLEDFSSMHCRNQLVPGRFQESQLAILEQPVEKFRFRYRSEMSGTHGSLQGASSEKNRKATYPTVQLKNYNGPAVIRCSLYTYSKEVPEHCRQPHPHRLVMKNDSEDRVDPHDKRIDPQTSPGMKVVFKSMGIIHTAKKHIQDELKIKHFKLKTEEVHRNDPSRSLSTREESDIKRQIADEEKSINLNVVCLRFDAFSVDPLGVYRYICDPVYSNPIFNLKSAMTGDLKIVRMDNSTSPASGGKEIFLLVEKVAKKNIKVQIFEIDSNDEKSWFADAKFHETDVHHQYAIVVKTPPYRNTAIDEPTKDVFIALFRPSDGESSEPRPFTYTPDRTNKRKRGRYDGFSSSSSMSMEMVPSEPQIPAMILNVHDTPMINSEELLRVAPRVDSEEFHRLLPELMPELLTTFATEDFLPDVDVDAVACEDPRALDKDLKRLRKDFVQVGAYIKSKQPDIDKYLQKRFEDKTDDGNTILQLCFIHFKNEFAKELKNTLLSLIKRFKLYHLLNMQNNNYETVLHIAIRNGRTLNQLVDLPLEHMEVTHRGPSPLHLAIEYDYGLDELCTQLKSQGVLERINDDGITALQTAVEQQRIATVQKLIEFGAQANVQDNRDGNNILQTAVLKANEELVKYLVEHTKVNHAHCNFKAKTAEQLARECLTGIKRYNVLRILCPESIESNFALFESALVKDEEPSSSESEEEMELEIKTEDCAMEEPESAPVSFALLKELAKLQLDKAVIERLYEDLNFGYMLDTDAFEDRHPLEFLIHLALTNNVRVSEIRDTMVKHGIKEAVQCIDRLPRDK